MKIVSIERLVLALSVVLGSVMTLPAYAWPDTDEMNMCGSAVKNVRTYEGDFRTWAAHDVYVSHRGSNYYYSTNCPESKATKLKTYWKPGAKMAPAKAKTRKVHKLHKVKSYRKHGHKMHKPKHKKTADCIRTDRLNNSGAIVQRTRPYNKNYAHSYKQKQPKRKVAVDHLFHRQAAAALAMSKVKRVSKIHNPKHKKSADCIRTDGLNKTGAVVRVVRRASH